MCNVDLKKKYGLKPRVIITRRLLNTKNKLRHILEEKDGQGTTEYAILVGVLVVIAIVAIIAFRGKVQELWSAIADGINSL